MDPETVLAYQSYVDSGLTGSATSLDALYDGVSGPFSDQNSLRESALTRSRSAARDGDPGRIVIGIDFGTTHTSIAYAFVRPNLALFSVENDVNVLFNWTPRMQNMERVPSVISYTLAEHGHEQWGTDFSDDAVAVVNIKLELAVQPTMLDELELTWQALEMAGFLSSEYVKQSRPHQGYVDKPPEQIVTDYLKKTLDCLLGEFRLKFFPKSTEIFPTDIVMTTPADWPYEARNSIFRAFQRAGFNRETFPKLQDMLFITEAEAACMYVIRQLQESHRESLLKINECFILCEAGGVMVDATAFQVTQLEPRIEFKQITHPSNGRYGATMVNRSFKMWLRRIIGDANYRMLDPEGSRRSRSTSVRLADQGTLKRLMNDFEKQRNLFSYGSGTMYIDLPAPFDNLNIPSQLNQGELAIYAYATQMRTFFDPCVNNIIQLIQSQVQQVEMAHRRVKKIFLIGGFGQSPYLQEKLNQSFTLRSISLRRPDPYTETAVAQGAVIYGAEKSLHQNLKSCLPSPRSYGIVIDEVSIAHKYNPRNSRRDAISGNPHAQLRFAWLIRRDDLILSGEKTMVQKEFIYKFDTHRYHLPIYTYSDVDDDVPKSWATGRHEVESIGEVSINLSSVSDAGFEQYRDSVTGQIYLATSLTCGMSITSDFLEVEISSNERRVGYSKIRVSLTGQYYSSDLDD